MELAELTVRIDRFDALEISGTVPSSTSMSRSIARREPTFGRSPEISADSWASGSSHRTAPDTCGRLRAGARAFPRRGSRMTRHSATASTTPACSAFPGGT